MLSNCKRKAVLAIGTISIVFIGIFVGLCIYTASYNKGFTSGMKYDKSQGQAKYYSCENGMVYRYKAKKPWDLSCFASVCDEKAEYMMINSEGDLVTDGMTMVLYIWPDKNSYVYGLDFYECDDEFIQEQVTCNGDWSSLDNELVKKYYDEIVVLMEAANKKWNLDSK